MLKTTDTLYKIGIVGYGVVGKGIHRLFGESVKAIYDPGYSKSGMYIDFKDLDLVVVSVPTNESVDKTADLSIMEDTLDWLSEVSLKSKEPLLVLIKSTTPPNKLRQYEKNCKNLRLVFSPEYMGESKYFTPFWKYPDPVEMKYHDFQTFGGKPEYTSACVDIFIRVMGPHVKFHQTDIVTAGLAKYMENIFFATKVTFCNEWYDIAKAYEVDYNELRELWLLDSRISPMHTAVFPKDRGFGGKCYPKDLRALIEDAKTLGHKPNMSLAVDVINKSFRSRGIPKKVPKKITTIVKKVKKK